MASERKKDISPSRQITTTFSKNGALDVQRETPTEARERVVMELLNRYQAGRGEELPKDWIHYLLDRLNALGYSSGQHVLAAEYIEFGPPMIFGNINLASFYPNEDELRKLGIRFSRKWEATLQRRYDEGYRAGWEARDREDAQPPTVIQMTAVEEARLKSKEEELDKLIDRNDEIARTLHATIDRIARHERISMDEATARVAGNVERGETLKDALRGALKGFSR